jgi:hypothetical protein
MKARLLAVALLAILLIPALSSSRTQRVFAQANGCIAGAVDGGFWAFTNNCGKTVNIVVVQNPMPPYGTPTLITQTLTPGQTQTLGAASNFPYRYWACPIPKSPTDVSTGITPTYQSTDVVCR